MNIIENHAVLSTYNCLRGQYIATYPTFYVYLITNKIRLHFMRTDSFIIIVGVCE